MILYKLASANLPEMNERKIKYFCYFSGTKENSSKVLQNNGSEYHSAACTGVRSLTVSVVGEALAAIFRLLNSGLSCRLLRTSGDISSVDTFQDTSLSFWRVSTDFLCHILNDENDILEKKIMGSKVSMEKSTFAAEHKKPGFITSN